MIIIVDADFTNLRRRFLESMEYVLICGLYDFSNRLTLSNTYFYVYLSEKPKMNFITLFEMGTG